MPGTESFNDLKRYVGLTEADEARLALLQGPMEREIDTILDEFYDTIQKHPDAAAAFADPVVQIPRQRGMLTLWLHELLKGPYDETHYRRTQRIGHAHVVHRLPQRYMHGAMNIIRRGLHRLSFDLHEGDASEVRRLVESVDRVLDVELWVMLRTYRDDMVMQMQRRERLATVGELSAGIHHELKNPLASIAAASLALDERRAVRADSRSRDLVKSIRSDASRASEIVSDLLSFARLREPVRDSVHPDDLVQAAIGRVTIPPRCRLEVDLDPGLPQVRVDRAQILQVLINVLENAVEACPGGGSIRVVSRLDDGAVKLSVLDDGIGMTAAELSRVFEPLYSTKPDGVGLGMSLSLQLARSNDVGLEVHSSEGDGTTVRLAFPVVEAL